MGKKVPKMIQSERGELVTAGQWITNADLEARDRQIAEYHYGYGVQTGLSQFQAFLRPLHDVEFCMVQANAISTCTNGNDTRRWAKTVLEALETALKVSKEVWQLRHELHAIKIDPRIEDYFQTVEGVIEKLRAYTKENRTSELGKKGKIKLSSNREEHAALRAFFSEHYPEMERFHKENLGATPRRPKKDSTQYIGERILELMTNSSTIDYKRFGLRIYFKLHQMDKETRQKIEGAAVAYKELSELCYVELNTPKIKKKTDEEDYEQRLFDRMRNAKAAVDRAGARMTILAPE